jgi:hypothetical protein
MAMTSGQDASPDSKTSDNDDADTGTDVESDVDPGADSDIDPSIDTQSLQRSRDAIDQGKEAAREALEDDADVAGEAES